MRQNLTNDIISFEKYNIIYSAGNSEVLAKMQTVPALEPFSDITINFLNCVSKTLLTDKAAKTYPDVITLAFWMRRASIEALKKRFNNGEAGVYRIGRGIAFHIAPSNVPVNYAYSLVSGLLCGNANIVRIPSKEFPQVNIINMAIKKALEDNTNMIPYITLVKYGHDSFINDVFSSIADIRVIWGGDGTINELRKSKMKPRATEVTFSDRYSLAVIDSEVYLSSKNKSSIANDFYNDTYLTDQNACTSPRVVAWMGKSIPEAKKTFWDELHKIVVTKYEIQGVQAVNKLTSGYLLAVAEENVRKEKNEDNLIVRMNVDSVFANLMELKENSGYFFEYDCSNILELKELCNNIKCQTVSYIGEKEMLLSLVKSGVKGIDRVVPVGKTMDFDLIWDGYNLFERMTRIITLS